MYLWKPYELTDLYRVLDSVKDPDARTRKAKERVLGWLLEMVESMEATKYTAEPKS